MYDLQKVMPNHNYALYQNSFLPLIFFHKMCFSAISLF